MTESVNFVETIRKALNDAASGALLMPEELFFVGQDEVKRGRFVSNFEDRVAVVMHNRFQYMMPQPCLRQYDETCPFHDGALEPKETKTHYAWTLWSYDDSARRVGLWKPSQNTPIAQMLDLFELKETINDRDALFTKTGKGPKTTVRVKMWMDPEPFKGGEVVTFTEAEILKILKKLIKKRTVEELRQPLEQRKET